MVPTQSHSAAADSGISDQSSLSLPVHLVLEVTKGRTRFRRRPVTQPRFLIGAGSTCDLRLGGDQMPALHSIITVSGREICLEAIAAEPVLSVNGRTVHTTSLHDGDVIAVGDVELLARFEAGHSPAGAQITDGPSPQTIDELLPAELSAGELVDLIDREQREIDDFERRQQDGAHALVNAIMGRSRRRDLSRQGEAGIRAPVPAPHFLSKRPQILAAQTRHPQNSAERDPELQKELDALGRQVTSLSQEIKGNSLRAAEREAHYANAADVLLETQDKLATQLEILIDKVQTLSSQDTALPKPRAIA